MSKLYLVACVLMALAYLAAKPVLDEINVRLEEAASMQSKRVNTVSVSTTSTAHSNAAGWLASLEDYIRYNATTRDRLPLPFQIVEQYRRQHGIDAVRSDKSNPQQRQFALVWMPCFGQDLAMDIQLQYALTRSLLWAILTNRTIIYQPWDTQACRKYYGDKLQTMSCDFEQEAPPACDSMLQLQPWIASYQELAGILELQQQQQQQMEPFVVPIVEQNCQTDDATFFILAAGLNNTTIDSHQLVAFVPSLLEKTSDPERWYHDSVSSAWAKQTSRQLFSLGSDFLFGALHHTLLSWHPRQVEKIDSRNTNRAVSIGVYFETTQNEEACNIQGSLRCLESLIHRYPNRLTNIHILSDPKCTAARQELKDAMNIKNTTSVRVIDPTNDSFGAFWQGADVLSMASQNGFIASDGPASDAIRSLIVINEKMRAWKAGLEPNKVDLYQCNTKTANRPEVSSKDSICSCDNALATSECCQRVVRPSHKMGYVLSWEIFQNFPLTINVTQDKRWELPDTDYRDVIVTRDWYESIISGYLYHKSGRECSLDPYGNPFNYSDTRFMNTDWERYMSRTKLSPSKNGRDLCRYLSEVSLYDGMRTYIDVAFGRWYDGIERTLNLAAKEQNTQKTLFMCYEQLSDPDSIKYVVRRMVEWMFPAGNAPAWDLGSILYDGGHATSHEADLRAELTNVIKILDNKAFHGKIAALQAQLGCENDLPRVE